MTTIHPPPKITSPEPEYSYILFTDNPNIKAPSPWKVRVLPRIFNDPQLDARRVKILPHLFLSNFEASIYIDANISISSLPYKNIIDLLELSPIILLPHEERSCIYEEAKEIIKGQFDSSAQVEAQMNAYRTIGFPGNYGLHATMILIRRHLDQECMRFNIFWWNQVATHSKRDQLSFDYIKWLLKTTILTLPIRYTENSLFEWGKDKKGSHQKNKKIYTEHLRRKVHKKNVPFSFLAANYSDSYEIHNLDFTKKLKKLNHIIQSTEENLEGNLCYFNLESTYTHSPPDPRRGERRENYLKTVAGKKRILEVGYNGGHSALLALCFTNAHFTAIDIASHAYTKPTAEFLKEKYPERFTFMQLDSRNMFDDQEKINFKQFDLFHIDGGHDKALYINDILTIVHLGSIDAIVLVDDVYVEDIYHFTELLVSDGYLEPYDDICTKESAAFVIKKTFPFDRSISFHTFIERQAA